VLHYLIIIEFAVISGRNICSPRGEKQESWEVKPGKHNSKNANVTFYGMCYIGITIKGGTYFMAVTQPVRSKHQVRELAAYYLKRGEIRNHVLIVMGVHTALRIGDLLRLTWDDVYDFERGRVRDSISVTEKKTGKSRTVALNDRIRSALALYAPAAKRGKALIESR
jgi:hypothetical protein